MRPGRSQNRPQPANEGGKNFHGGSMTERLKEMNISELGRYGFWADSVVFFRGCCMPPGFVSGCRYKMRGPSDQYFTVLALCRPGFSCWIGQPNFHASLCSGHYTTWRTSTKSCCPRLYGAQPSVSNVAHQTSKILLKTPRRDIDRHSQQDGRRQQDQQRMDAHRQRQV